MNSVRTSGREAAPAQAATSLTTATNPLWMITAALAVFAGVMVMLISL